MKFFSLGKLKLSVKDLCVLALLTAITVILAIFATIRVGNMIKIPLKFISVFITGVFFGPVWAAISATLGDVLNALIAPVGPFMPQITMIEFISGFIFGLFMYGTHESKQLYALRVILCVVMQFMLDMFFTPIFLVQVGYFPSYLSALAIRLPASLIKAALQTIVLFMGRAYLKRFAINK